MERNGALRETVLPAGFILDNILRDSRKIEDYNYENYLREYLNVSEWFLRKSSGEKYKKPVSETHGEDDAYTEEYSIDFKRILGESATRELQKTSERVLRTGSGNIYEFGGAYQRPGNALEIRQALRGYGPAELDDLSSVPREEASSQIEQDIIAYLHLLGREKNLFLYDPVVFYLPVPYLEEEAERIIMDALHEDFGVSLDFRRRKAQAYETYISFFFEKDLMIFQYTEKGFVPTDRIPARLSSTFCSIASFYGDRPVVEGLL